VAPRGVVGRAQDFGDFGDLFFYQPLDSLLQRDVRGAAALAAATHLKVDPVILHVDELDEAAVAGDRGVDHRIDQLLNSGLQILAHEAPLKPLLYPSLRSGPTGPRWAPLSRTTARSAAAAACGGPPPPAAGARPGRGVAPAPWSASSRTR